MDEHELRELQDPATWSDESEILPPVQSPRAVVSVAFARDDYARVSKHAKRREMKTSPFIREAVLEQIAASEGGATIISVTGGVQTRFTAPKRRRPRSKDREPSFPVVTTA